MIIRPCLLLFALWTPAGAALSQDTAPVEKPKPEYVYKNDDVRTGSSIRTNMASASLPLDVSYSDFTPEQKASWKSQYQSMPADDEPPYPLTGPKTVMKAVLKAVQRTGYDGEIEAIVVVRDDGTPDSVSVIKAPTDKLGKFVAQALMVEKYKPAVCGGKPCAMEYPFKMTVRLTPP